MFLNLNIFSICSQTKDLFDFFVKRCHLGLSLLCFKLKPSGLLSAITRQIILCFQTMRKRQREMQENGGSLGCLGLEVSTKFAQLIVITVRHTWIRHLARKLSGKVSHVMLTLLYVLMQWKTTVATICLRVTARRKRRKSQRRKKRRNPRRRNLLFR